MGQPLKKGCGLNNLTLIPIELLLETSYNFLSLADASSLCKSCKLFYESIFCNDLFWIELAKRQGIYSNNDNSTECRNKFRMQRFSNFFQDCAKNPSKLPKKHSNLTISDVEYFLRSDQNSNEMKKVILAHVLPLFKKSKLYPETLQRIIIFACKFNNPRIDNILSDLVDNTDRFDMELIESALQLNFERMDYWLNSLVSAKVLKKYQNKKLERYDMYDLALFFLKKTQAPYCQDHFLVYFPIFQSYQDKKQDYKEKYFDIVKNPNSARKLIEKLQIFNQEDFELVISADNSSLFFKKEYCRKIVTTNMDSLGNDLKQKAFDFFINYQGKSWEPDYLFSTYTNIIVKITNDDFIEKNRHFFSDYFFNHWKEVIETQEILIELSKIDLNRTIKEMLEVDPPIYLRLSRLQKTTEIINIFKKYSTMIEANEQEKLMKNLVLALKQVLNNHGKLNSKHESFLEDVVEWMKPIYPESFSLLRKDNL